MRALSKRSRLPAAGCWRPEQIRIYIMVDDISDTLKKIDAAGGRVLTPRKDIAPGSGAFAVFADPAGTEFGLYEEPKR